MLALAPSAPDAARRLDLAAEIVSAYVSNNSLPAGELPDLLRTVHDALATVYHGRPPADLAPEPPKPAVPIRKSVHDDFIVCLENGRRFKSLKRHLASAHGLTPDQYRARWGLPKDYPMVAAAYASARSALAREIGLGRRPEGGERSADPGPSLEGAALRPRPRRRPEADEAVS